MEWWQELRKVFPVTELCTYMDTAFDCGGSTLGRDAAIRYFEDWKKSAASGIKGGPGRRPFFEIARKGKKALSALLGDVPPRNIAYTKNTNEGINAIVQGFQYHPGANIITSVTEYPSVLMPCLNAEILRNVECRLVKPGSEPYVPWQKLWEAVDSNTEMIVVSHVQSTTGYKIDLETLGQKCKENGIFLVVDAIQSVGFEPILAEKWGVSAVSAGGYKGLGGSISLGFLYCSDDLLARISPVYVSSGFGIYVDFSKERPEIMYQRQMGAAILENCSTDYLGVYVLQAATQRLLDIGLEQIESHIDNLFCQLYDGLKNLGFSVITPRCKVHRCAVLSVTCADCDALLRTFFQENVIVSGGKDMVRISIGPYTSPADIQRVLAAAKNYLAICGTVNECRSTAANSI